MAAVKFYRICAMGVAAMVFGGADVEIENEIKILDGTCYTSFATTIRLAGFIFIQAFINFVF